MSIRSQRILSGSERQEEPVPLGITGMSGRECLFEFASLEYSKGFNPSITTTHLTNTPACRLTSLDPTAPHLPKVKCDYHGDHRAKT